LEETPFGAKSNFGVNIGKWMTTPTSKIIVATIMQNGSLYNLYPKVESEESSIKYF
jgi:hypothetical protein